MLREGFVGPETRHVHVVVDQAEAHQVVGHESCEPLQRPGPLGVPGKEGLPAIAAEGEVSRLHGAHLRTGASSVSTPGVRGTLWVFGVEETLPQPMARHPAGKCATETLPQPMGSHPAGKCASATPTPPMAAHPGSMCASATPTPPMARHPARKCA